MNEALFDESLLQVPYIKIVKQFAIAKGIKLLNWVDITDALYKYIESAKVLN